MSNDHHSHPPIGAAPPAELTTDEYQRMVARSRFSVQMLSDRVAGLTRENVELMAIVQELQRDLYEARQIISEVQEGEAMLGGIQVSPGLIMPQA
jgi:hypothetical protein